MRLVYSPLWISLKDLFYEEPKGRILVISSLGKWKSPQITAVDHWMRKGGRVLAAGISPHWGEWLGLPSLKVQYKSIEHPSGAFGAMIAEEDRPLL